MDAALVVALGSLLVAVLGFIVNARAIRREQADRTAQIEAEWAREWAAQRPVVYPVGLPEWAYASEGSPYRGGNAMLLPIKNGGRGPALNVHGEISVAPPESQPYERTVLAGTIAAGDLLDARVVPYPGVHHWLHADGVLRYSDLAGTDWETRFEMTAGPDNSIVVTSEEPKPLSPEAKAPPAASDS
jgi:hypothetical protein